jgi:hypothetical protein
MRDRPGRFGCGPSGSRAAISTRSAEVDSDFQRRGAPSRHSAGKVGKIMQMLERYLRRTKLGATVYLAANVLLILQEPFFHIMQRLTIYDVIIIKQMLAQ